MTVTLRAVEDADLDRFFEFQCDREAAWQVAFTSQHLDNRAEFDLLWTMNRANPSSVVRTIVADGAVAGSILAFDYGGQRLVGYWLGREFWGRGVASEALRQMLGLVSERPLYARVAKDNAASQRVLEKCGFVIDGSDFGYSYARGCDVEEWILCLR